MNRRVFASGIALVLALASTASASIRRFEIVSDAPDAVRVNGGLAGDVYYGRVSGGFSVETNLSAGTAILSDFDLKVTDVVSLNPAFDPAQIEGKLLQELLPVVMSSLQGTASSDDLARFGLSMTAFAPVPSASMFLVRRDDDWTVLLSANFDDGFVLDGGSMLFKRLTAATVPESSTIALMLIGVSATSVRYRLTAQRKRT
jgi:hypothetical protein